MKPKSKETILLFPGKERVSFGIGSRYAPVSVLPKLTNVHAQVRGGSGAIFCLCNSQEMQPISIRKRVLEKKKEIFFFAIYPGTGSSHAATCVFYQAKAEFSGKRAYSDGVIAVSGSGEKITLGYSLVQDPEKSQRVEGIDSAIGDKSKNSSDRNRANKVTALGLLHLLWEKAGLNVWSINSDIEVGECNEKCR
jgi:hypothetical protein